MYKHMLCINICYIITIILIINSNVMVYKLKREAYIYTAYYLGKKNIIKTKIKCIIHYYKLTTYIT